MAETLATEKGIEFALEALEKRRKENRGKKTDNSSLRAGSTMYFYCKSCGALADTLPEMYTSIPKSLCGECQALKDLGWLRKGMKKSTKNLLDQIEKRDKGSEERFVLIELLIWALAEENGDLGRIGRPLKEYFNSLEAKADEALKTIGDIKKQIRKRVR